jgi:hypothetical protein
MYYDRLIPSSISKERDRLTIGIRSLYIIADSCARTVRRYGVRTAKVGVIFPDTTVGVLSCGLHLNMQG